MPEELKRKILEELKRQGTPAPTIEAVEGVVVNQEMSEALKKLTEEEEKAARARREGKV